jgi:AraC-like DNA-binding protein
MHKLTRKRSTTSVLLMINVAGKKGISREVCLKDTGITDEILADSRSEINPEQELKLIENFVDLQNDNQVDGAFAVEIGQHYHLTAYGIFGFAVSTSPDVRTAIEVGLNYLPLTFAFSQFRMVEEHNLGYMVVDADHISEKVRRFVVERDMTAMLCMHQEIFGQVMPLEGLELQWQGGANSELYHCIYPGEPRYQQIESKVIFNRTLLDLTLPTANEQSRTMFVAQCQDLMQKRHEETGVALKVRNYILGNIDQKISMDAVAHQLCVSLRTLRRQLKEEGTSFRILTDEVRETLAVHLIQETALTMEQISIRLGYSDTANFFHAFKRWTGYPPMHYRTTML